MNPEFKVLTNANESNLQAPLIQSRFRKLTLQSPKQQSNVQHNVPGRLPPQSKLATDHFVNPPVSPYKSQTQTINNDGLTNKLMLSTSSGNNTERTNFINVETEPFTNPLQVESTETERFINPLRMKNTENEKNSPPKNSSGSSDNHKELTSQMEKLEVSRVSTDMFSQFSSLSKLSLPPNRILSNKENENVDNLSQRMSNIRMTDHGDLADTQPNTSSQFRGNLENCGVETQPPIILISDGEEDNDSDTHNSLLTEESDDDSVIEVLSSEDEVTEDEIPQNVSPINTQADDEELTESVAQKLNHFFDNIPKLDASINNYQKIDSERSEWIGSDIIIPETTESLNENNAPELQASQLDEGLDRSGNPSTGTDVSRTRNDDKHQKNATLNDTSGKPDEVSIHHTRLEECDRTTAKDNESESQSHQNESSNMGSERPNQSTDDNQLSIRETTSKNEYDKIKTTSKNVFRVNSPIINISARVNINIQVSGFSSSSSETSNATSENVDDQSSIQSSKNNESLLSEAGANSSHEVAIRWNNAGSASKNFVDISPNHEQSDGRENDADNNSSGNNDDNTIDSSIIESSTNKSHRTDKIVECESDEDNTSAIRKSMTSICIMDKESNLSKETKSTDTSDSSKEKESIDIESHTMKQDDNNITVSPVDSSVEINEIGENLLTEIYGDTWRTPQLIRKCVSTKKKYWTDATKTTSLDFSMFQKDIPSELESTRITPCVGKRKLFDQSQFNLSPNEKSNGGDANQSSRIVRTRRKVIPNRIVDSSDDDDNDGNQSSSSFEPLASESGEESDGSDADSDYSQKVVKPKPTRRKRNQFVFFDLTCQDVIEDEDHESPDATPDELEKVGNTFLESLQSKTNVKTPAPVKKNNVPSSTTKRKLFTPNYDDQTPFEEMKTPTRLPSENNNKTIQLKTPIPSYLIPTQFRDKAKIDASPFYRKSVHASKDLKKLKTPPCTPKPLPVCGFLESLDDKLIPVEHCDPEALKFRTNFETNRNELIKRLMKIFNHYIFDNKLTNIPVTWSKRLTTTAGVAKLRKRGGVRISVIELSEKLNTSAERVRDTLIHELCHAAAWIIDGYCGHHGKIWKYWAERSNKRFPELPEIVRCHNYDIPHKYTYKCAICGKKSLARSKSKKVENIRCASCHGPIELFENKTEEDGTITLVPPKEPSIFANFVKENYKLHKVAGASHADVMKSLSNNFGKLTALEKTKFKN